MSRLYGIFLVQHIFECKMNPILNIELDCSLRPSATMNLDKLPTIWKRICNLIEIYTLWNSVVLPSSNRSISITIQKWGAARSKMAPALEDQNIRILVNVDFLTSCLIRRLCRPSTMHSKQLCM